VVLLMVFLVMCLMMSLARWVQMGDVALFGVVVVFGSSYLMVVFIYYRWNSPGRLSNMNVMVGVGFFMDVGRFAGMSGHLMLGLTGGNVRLCGGNNGRL